MEKYLEDMLRKMGEDHKASGQYARRKLGPVIFERDGGWRAIILGNLSIAWDTEFPLTIFDCDAYRDDGDLYWSVSILWLDIRWVPGGNPHH